MKKRIITLAILLGVCVLLVGGILIAKSITERQSNPPITDDKDYCFQVDQDQITSIRWAFSANEELTLLKNDSGEWHLKDEPERKLNETKVKTILNSVEEIPYHQEIPNADLKTYGLDNPTNVVTVTCAGKEYTFTFGPMNAMQTMYYMLFDGHVYLVDPYENTVFDKTREIFYDEDTEIGEVTETEVNESSLNSDESQTNEVTDSQPETDEKIARIL